MILEIIEFSAAIISLPAIAYVFWMGEASTLLNIIYTICFLAVSPSDYILKPLLPDRNVEAPIPIIVIGAWAGMISSGIIGLSVD